MVQEGAVLLALAVCLDIVSYVYCLSQFGSQIWATN